MTSSSHEKGLLQSIKDLRLIRHLRRKRGLSFYLSERGGGLHYGAFASFAEARQWLPPSKEFEHAEFADDYEFVRTQRVFSFDYPVMFWLRKAFEAGATSIFDIGGSVGVHYYAYRPFVEYPTALKWHVYELPSSVTRGRELAQSQAVSSLAFCEDLDSDAIQSDIWMSAGAIEFIEHTSIEKLLSETSHRPQHILLNKLPLHDGEDYVSTQNIGQGSFVPHYVYNRGRYVGEIERLGYRLADSWDINERAFAVPGWPERSFRPYSGLYFRAI